MGILDTAAVADFIENNQHPLAGYIREQLPYDVRQELTRDMEKEQSRGSLKQTLASALNAILKDSQIPDDVLSELKLSSRTESLINSVASAKVEANRRVPC